jgi:thiol-disulfide isomerase/thioredoxin
MDIAVLVVRIAVAGVLVVAGVAKALDVGATRRSIPALGLPQVLAGPIAIALPAVELALGLLLVPVATARLAAAAATLLFSAFSVVVGVALVRGRDAECHCFGQLSSEPIGVATVVRSALLAVAAAFVAIGWVEPPLGLLGWLSTLSEIARVMLAADVAILLALAMLGLAAGRLSRRQGEILRRLDALEPSRQAPASGAEPVASLHGGPAIGTEAPRFSLPKADGTPGSLEALLRRGHQVLLLFLNPRCVPCEMLLPEIARWSRDDASVFTLGVVSRGDLGENLRMSARCGSATVMVQRGMEVDDAYEVTGTPAAVLVGADGKIASPLAISALEIKALVVSIGGSARPLEVQGHDRGHVHPRAVGT